MPGIMGSARRVAYRFGQGVLAGFIVADIVFRTNCCQPSAQAPLSWLRLAACEGSVVGKDGTLS